MMKKRLFRNRGFTLLELLLVIILISVLAAMTVPRFIGRTEKAKIAAANADINANLSIALDLYELDTGGYPTTAQALKGLVSKPSQPPTSDHWQGPYIKLSSSLNDPWGNPYRYQSPGIHNIKSYDLFSLGPDGVEGSQDDITNWGGDEDIGL